MIFNHSKVLKSCSLSPQSLASCVNYFVWNCFKCSSNTSNRFRYKFFDIVQFSRSCQRLRSFDRRLDYFITEVIFCQALFSKAIRTFWTWSALQFLGTNRNFQASIGSFLSLRCWASEVILLSQRLALKYNTIHPAPCQHFFTGFFKKIQVFVFRGGILQFWGRCYII